MNTSELNNHWQKYGVVLQNDGRDIIKPLKDCFAICWGPTPNIPDALLFDKGGEQGAAAYTLKVGENGEDLISVNPMNPTETTILGKLVLLENSHKSSEPFSESTL